MPSWGAAFGRCYTFHGAGDIAAATAVQARVRDYGVCSYFNWDPRPPRWRFFYETDLSHAQLNALLGRLCARFGVVVEK